MSQFADSPDAPQPSRKSGGGLKILLIVLAVGGGLVLLACGGLIVGSIYFFNKSFSDDPATIRSTANEITEIDVPESYDPLFSMDVMGMRMAAFGEGQGQQAKGQMLMLMAFPEGMADEQQMRQQMKQSLQQQGNQQNLRQLESETRAYSIRGEECDVQIARAEDPNGGKFRQITTVFTAKNGSPAMLMVIIPEEDWTEGGDEEFEAMLESME